MGFGLISWAAAKGLEGGGKEGVDVAKSAAEHYRLQEHEKFKSDLAMQRETALAQLREDIRRGGMKHDLDFNTNPGNVQKRVDAEKSTILGVAPAKAEEKKIIGAAETQVEIDRFSKLAPLQRDEAIKTELEKLKALSTPEALKASRAIAMSKHIVDPSYQLIPQADGTVVTFDARSGKTGGVLKGPDGKEIVRKDPEELKAATSVINLATANLRIAQAEHKAAQADPMLDAAAKARADATWAIAQEEAKRLSAPAYAVLYGKAKVGDTSAPATAPKDRAPLSSFQPGGNKPAEPAGSKGGDAGDRALGRAPSSTAAPPKTAKTSGDTPNQFDVLNEGKKAWDSQKKPD